MARLWAGSISAKHSGGSSFSATYVEAENKYEAVGKAIANAEYLFPMRKGYSDHQASVIQIEDSDAEKAYKAMKGE